MIEISAYIFVAILLGYFFGWLITKILLKERYQTSLDEIILDKNIEIADITKIKDELFQTKKDNKRLKAYNKELNSGYDGQKYVLDEYNETLDEFQKRLLSKDEVIEKLTSKLSLSEEREMNIEKKYEEEIDAFMFERIDITQKYKNLLKKFNLLKQHKGMLRDKDTWFSKFFSSSPSSVH
jgi:antitoxin component HigA of HigAB toxin-antitoxin module